MTPSPAVPSWVKARASDSAGACVEVKLDGSGYHLRDSKDATGLVLTLSPADWERFCTVVLAGPGPRAEVGELHLDPRPDGRLAVHGPTGTLRYTAAEVACFRDGLRHDEFTVRALTAA